MGFYPPVSRTQKDNLPADNKTNTQTVTTTYRGAENVESIPLTPLRYQNNQLSGSLDVDQNVNRKPSMARKLIERGLQRMKTGRRRSVDLGDGQYNKLDEDAEDEEADGCLSSNQSFLAFCHEF